MNVGDRVQLAEIYLKATDYDPEEVKRRGTIAAAVDETFVQVDWGDEGGLLRTVHRGNLCPAQREKP